MPSYLLLGDIMSCRSEVVLQSPVTLEIATEHLKVTVYLQSKNVFQFSIFSSYELSNKKEKKRRNIYRENGHSRPTGSKSSYRLTA